MTNMDLKKELELAEKYETEVFFKMANQLYSDCAVQCETLFDIAMDKTEGFKSITPEVLQEDGRIIKILRYCVIPTISQMKLGQLVGIDSTADFEESCSLTRFREEQLRKIVPKLCEIFIKNLDSQRFLWNQAILTKSNYEIAVAYAKKWTCSPIANQNSGTAFRNWRKERQESKAANEIIEAGYKSIKSRPFIKSPDSLLPGQYSRECKIMGRNNQKADIAVRLKKSGKLLLIEAKAIGVKLDAFKRIKECREKFDDWKATFGDDVIVGVVLSGFMPEHEAQSLLDEGILVFWEHNIKELGNYVEKN